MTERGKTHAALMRAADEALGAAAHLASLMAWNNTGGQSDLEHRKDWQVLWQLNLSR